MSTRLSRSGYRLRSPCPPPPTNSPARLLVVPPLDSEWAFTIADASARGFPVNSTDTLSAQSSRSRCTAASTSRSTGSKGKATLASFARPLAAESPFLMCDSPCARTASVSSEDKAPASFEDIATTPCPLKLIEKALPNKASRRETPDTPILPLREPKPATTPESAPGAVVIVSSIRENVYLLASNAITAENPSETSNELPSTVLMVS